MANQQPEDRTKKPPAKKTPTAGQGAKKKTAKSASSTPVKKTTRTKSQSDKKAPVGAAARIGAKKTPPKETKPLEKTQAKSTQSRAKTPTKASRVKRETPVPEERSERLFVRPLPDLKPSRWKGRLRALLIIITPSVFLLLGVFILPWLVEKLSPEAVVETLVPPPTNLLPSIHDELYHSPTLILSNQILAYYGHPQARWMGIVGRHSKEELGRLLKKTALDYERVRGSLGVVPAYYLIWGSAQPRGEIQLMDQKILESYIHYTATNGFLLILDHQIGKYGPVKAIELLLPFLRYPHVHLAIDPEWRTLRPMKEIGHVTGDEINRLQAMMRDYILTNHIPGKRMLIIHQFESKMIERPEAIRTDFDPVVFVHSISGWGSPSMKLGTWNRYLGLTNLPHKGFKLWYHPGVERPGLHYDRPLMSPQEVLSLRPLPRLIMYQ